MLKTILLLAALLPSFAVAGGFQLNTQGQHALSMGGAFTAFGKGASTVFYNPGAMSFTEKKAITIGGTFVKTNTNYLSPYNGNVEAENPSLIPFHAYLNYLLTDNISVGLAINNPFRSDFKWADNWEGRYVTREMNLNAWYIQPTVSYKVNENLGIGAGVVYGLGNIGFRRAIPVEGAAPFGQEELKINGNGWGFNLGLFYKFNKEGSIGINYRSAIKFNMKNGDATFSDIPITFSETYPSTLKFNTSVKCPSVISAAIAYKFTSALTTTIQLDFTAWSSLDSLNFIFPDHSEVDIRTARNAKNSVCGRVGGQYSFTENLDVRIGAAYDLASVPQDHLSPDLPEADKILLSAGAGYKFNKMLSADIAVGMENYFERKGQFSDANLSGSYKSNSIMIGLGLNYEF
ncbi:MAG TPA: outer membrane protein transport protein [Bacteroidia bacterium]|nr:outer membrane protein transport protein [Bacteroidia bacterium]